MDVSVTIIILVVIFVGLRFIFSSSGSKNSNKTNEDNSSNHSESSTRSPTSSPGSSGAGSSLLNQLSMINSKSFPALSTKQLPQKLEAFFGRKDSLHEVAGKTWAIKLCHHVACICKGYGTWYAVAVLPVEEKKQMVKKILHRLVNLFNNNHCCCCCGCCTCTGCKGVCK